MTQKVVMSISLAWQGVLTMVPSTFSPPFALTALTALYFFSHYDFETDSCQNPQTIRHLSVLHD